MKEMPDECIQCCVTSPPYWGLRDYNIEPQIWDGKADCVHEWITYIKKPTGGKGSKGANVGANKNDFANMRDHDVKSDFCSKCGAWRGCLGLEPTPELYVQHIIQIFREVRRILKKDGTLWLNLGDSYAGSNCGSNDYRPKNASISANSSKYKGQRPGLPSNLKSKDLVGIPWRVAFALQADGWWLRSDIIWHKPNPMPESCRDRPTKSHEYIFLMTKNSKYYYDAEAIREVANPQTQRGKPVNSTEAEGNTSMGGRRTGYEKYGRYKVEFRNKRSVWTVATQPFSEAHFATFPLKLVEPCILAGCPEGGIVFDPFMGSGTTAVVANKLRRNYIGIEASEEYCKMAEKRIKQATRQRRLF